MHDSPKTGGSAALGWLRRQLKSPGYRFGGRTSVYAFMQNVGVVTNHVHGCFRASLRGPMGHNPAINAYRKRTLQMRAVDEHSPLMSDLALAGRYFDDVGTRFFAL